jgi:hypothetical protein
MADDFATRGNIASPDGIAALALVRSLLQHLHVMNVLPTEDAKTVIGVAAAQIPADENINRKEARRLLALLDHQF